MQFIDTLREQHAERRKVLRAEEKERKEQERQDILADAKKTVQDVVDVLVREAENGECLAFPQNVTMKYEPEKTLWTQALQDYAKEEGIDLCIDYNFGVMEFFADPRNTECAPLSKAFTALTEEITSNYAADAKETLRAVTQNMSRQVQEGSGNEERITAFVRLLHIAEGGTQKPVLFANWKSSLEFMQYTNAEEMLSDLKNVQTADDLKAVFSSPENRLLRPGQSLQKMVYAIWRNAENAGLTVIKAGEWMPFDNMTVSILLLTAEL